MPVQPLQAARVRHAVDKDGIHAAVREGLAGIRECYGEWLKVQPDLGGHVKVTFTIDTDDGIEGKITRASVGDGGMGHLAMDGCILSVFEDLRFEAPLKGPINVTYPLTLTPDTDAGQ